MSDINVVNIADLPYAPAASGEMYATITDPVTGNTYKISYDKLRELIGLPNPIGIEGQAKPETIPITTGFVIYNVAEIGTYTHFPDSNGDPLQVTDEDFHPDGDPDKVGLLQFWGQDNIWEKQVIPIDLSTVLKKTDIINDLTTGGEDVPLSAEQGKVVKEQFGVGFENIMTSDNFLNLPDWLDGQAINTSGVPGPPSVNPELYAASPFFAWGEHTQFIAGLNGTAATIANVYQYDVNHILIVGSGQAGGAVATPISQYSGAVYFRLTILKANTNQLNWGAVLFPYDVFSIQRVGNKDGNGDTVIFKPYTKDADLVAKFATKYQGVTFTSALSPDILDVSQSLLGYSLSTTGVATHYMEEFAVSRFIPWAEYDQITAGKDGVTDLIQSYAQYTDAVEISFIPGSFLGGTVPSPISKVATANYIRVCYKIANINQICYGQSLTFLLADKDAVGNAGVFKPNLADADLVANFVTTSNLNASVQNGVNTGIDQLGIAAYNTHRTIRWKNKLINTDTSLATLTLLGDSWIARGYMPSELAHRLYSRYGNGGAGYITLTDLTQSVQGGVPIDGQCTIEKTGTWTYLEMADDSSVHALNGGQASMATGATATIVTTCEFLKIFYRIGTGTFTYNIDASGATTIDTSTGSGIVSLTLSAASHSIVLTSTAGAPVVQGLYCTNSTGVVVNNLGNGGSGTAQWKTLTSGSEWLNKFLAIDSDMTIVLHGTNDQSGVLESIKSNWQGIINNIFSINATTSLALMSSGDNLHTGSIISMQTMDATIFERAMSNNLMMLSSYKFMPKDLMELNNLYTSDGAHYEPDGFKILADFVFRNIIVF